MKKFKVISDSTLTHGGKSYEPGAEFEASPSAGNVSLWLQLKQIEEVKPEKEAKAPRETKAEREAREAAEKDAADKAAAAGSK